MILNKLFNLFLIMHERKRLNRSSKIHLCRKHLAQKKCPRLPCTWLQVQSALAKFFVKIYGEKVGKNFELHDFLHMPLLSLVFTSFHLLSSSLLSFIHHHQLSLRLAHRYLWICLSFASFKVTGRLRTGTSSGEGTDGGHHTFAAGRRCITKFGTFYIFFVKSQYKKPRILHVRNIKHIHIWYKSTLHYKETLYILFYSTNSTMKK